MPKGPAPDRRLFVCILTLPGVSAASAIMAYDDFVAVAGLEADMIGGDTSTAATRFSPRLVGTSLDPIKSATGLPIIPQRTLENTPECDVVFCPALLPSACVGPDGGRPEFDPGLLAWIRERYEAGAMIVSLCTGSYLLAEAGLLDGLPATCHWASARHFRNCYPGTEVKDDQSLVVTGSGGRVIVAGTGIYHQNLIIYLLQRLCGHEAAHSYARMSGKFWIEESQDVFARMTSEYAQDDLVIREAQCWFSENTQVETPVSDMAARAFLTERTFARRFRSATGCSPSEFVRSVRLERAKSLLETTRLPVEEISTRVGYREPSAFRRMFSRSTGLSPLDYRRRFKLPPLDAALSDMDRNRPIAHSSDTI